MTTQVLKDSWHAESTISQFLRHSQWIGSLSLTSFPRRYLITWGPEAAHTASPSMARLDICSGASGPAKANFGVDSDRKDSLLTYK